MSVDGTSADFTESDFATLPAPDERLFCRRSGSNPGGPGDSL